MSTEKLYWLKEKLVQISENTFWYRLLSIIDQFNHFCIMKYFGTALRVGKNAA